MQFELLPTLDIMIDFYRKPLNIDRFQGYLKMLQGDSKGDLEFPISGFNPMAKEHVLEKLLELKSLRVEALMLEVIAEENRKHADASSIVKVGFNLSDDLKGGWTNRYTSDYDSKFRINALVNRNFCVPVFWSGESYSGELIKQRTAEYIQRTVWWKTHPKLVSLKDHVEQEEFVALNAQNTRSLHRLKTAKASSFYDKNKDAEEYSLIFNFFFGDVASKSLAYPCYGISPEMAAFEDVAKSQYI